MLFLFLALLKAWHFEMYLPEMSTKGKLNGAMPVNYTMLSPSGLHRLLNVGSPLGDNVSYGLV